MIIYIKMLFASNERSGGTDIARKLRTWYPGAIYHLMERGVRRLEIFQDDFDKMISLKQISRGQPRNKGHSKQTI